ncbi:MAG: electron transfer flavoprotein subunit alpha/FixB family protein [Bacillota bacterium]
MIGLDHAAGVGRNSGSGGAGRNSGSGGPDRNHGSGGAGRNSGSAKGGVWVYAELDGTRPTVETREACLVGAWLASRIGGEVKLVFVDGPSLSYHEPRSKALAMGLAMEGPQRTLGRPYAVIFPESPRASGVAATLAATLETGLVSHCLEMVIDDDGELEMLVPAFGGLAAITCPEARPILVSLSAGAARRMGLAEADAAVEVVRLAVDERVRRLALGGPRPVARAEKAEGATGADSAAETITATVPDLSSARVVVGVGAGAATADVWPLVLRLAQRLGAAIGATRPAVDTGMVSEELMIGQSGARISPDLYIALGVSGDLQHTVGVENAKIVVAVNQDPAAPIFGRADCGVVARLEGFLPMLLTELDKARRR